MRENKLFEEVVSSDSLSYRKKRWLGNCSNENNQTQQTCVIRNSQTKFQNNPVLKEFCHFMDSKRIRCI